jgi:hypothetical protein
MATFKKLRALARAGEVGAGVALPTMIARIAALREGAGATRSAAEAAALDDDACVLLWRPTAKTP